MLVMEHNQTALLQTYNKLTVKDSILYFLSTAHFCTTQDLNHQLKPSAPLPVLAKSGTHISRENSSGKDLIRVAAHLATRAMGNTSLPRECQTGAAVNNHPHLVPRLKKE